MSGFIDIHNHLLPGVDDGPKSIEQTINMLRIAYAEGTRTIIATPHYQEDRYMVNKVVLEEKVREVSKAAKSAGIEMDIFLGCEIYYNHNCVKLLKEKVIPTMAGTKYVLVEFIPVADSRYIKNALQEILLEGFCPIVAHIERYEAFIKDLTFIENLLDMGVYMQVNSMSITNSWGKKNKSATRKLLRNNLIQFVATDAHNELKRIPRIRKCYNFLRKKYGEAYADELLFGNQQKLLLGQDI
ncbi:capsular biosynthesis protein [Anaerocolumna sp. AGMB13025]|uniref:CpsB/CapC family capsule biosynthesis tyrosine phosphatase n=1 Tax=Anaerocolumna sp. AGMB13025 TaxID=3039116 RepID=UPI00242046A1|nr:CpsB/CapC family capsule biosynthesis tyrosine phosphatase [Anaerocolumna sp. AGMB13025]WFR57875.1 capsular biosynthesis protein [Anaerocolumna sp. AGMB13025]